MYQRILVAVDGSPTSQQGLAEAIKIAKLTGGQLRLFHMVDEQSVVLSMAEYAASPFELFETMRENGKKVLADAQEQVTHEGIISDVVLNESYSGRLAELVVAEALTWPADLIVIGTHGRRGVGRMLLGSGAEQIVRLASMPVLLVRDRDGANAGPFDWNKASVALRHPPSIDLPDTGQ